MSQTLSALEIHTVSGPPSIFSYALSDSQRTTTETSTVWGPGTLSGRALLALGEVTIRGYNRLKILRRLATIRAHVPYLDKSMCDDLLELCRPALYSPRIGKAAARLIFTQICTESKYAMLVLALCEWPYHDARLTLLELIRGLSHLHPSEQQLDRIFDLLAAVIQYREEWRSLVLEVARLLRNMFQGHQLPMHHPIHVLCEDGSDIPPLLTPQKAYSFHMRAEIWLSLHACGFPWQERMLEIQDIMAVTSDVSNHKLLDAIADIVIFTRPGFNFELQCAAVSCLRQIHGRRWKSVCDIFGFPPDGFKSSTGRHREECTPTELADATKVLRTPPSKETDLFVDALVKLFVPSHMIYPSQIIDATTLRALQSICGGPGSSRTRVAASICALSTTKQVRAIERLVRDVELHLCSLDERQRTQAIRSFCDFLATVIQITGRYDYIIYEDIAISLVQLISLESEHSIGVLCREVIVDNDISWQLPFSKIQGSDSRKRIWLAAHAAGISLHPRLENVIQVLSQREPCNRIITPGFIDALTDAVIFTREVNEGFGGVFDLHESQRLLSTALDFLAAYEDKLDIPGLLPEYWLDSVLSGSDLLFEAWAWRIGRQYQAMPDVGQN